VVVEDADRVAERQRPRAFSDDDRVLGVGDRRALGERIRQARLALDLSQAELADAVGMTVESISRAERGVITPTIWTLLEMCRALETDLGALVGGPSRTQDDKLSPKLERAMRLMSKLSEEDLDPILDLLAVLEPRKERRFSSSSGSRS